MALPLAKVQECLGHVAVLINHVGQMVELVANLEVVRAPPTALEERHVLVELVVLVGVELGKTEKVGRSGSAASQRQIGWQGIAPRGARSGRGGVLVITSAHSTGNPHNVGSRGRPAKVVIVLKEVAEPGSGNDLRGQADVSTDVVGRGVQVTRLRFYRI